MMTIFNSFRRILGVICTFKVKSKQDPLRAILFFTLTAIFWGLNFHLAKIMLKETGFIEAGFWRYLFGVIPLMVLAVKNMPSWATIRQNIKGISLVGIVGLFGFNLFFFLGLVNGSAVNAALIVSLAPALTLISSYLLLKTPLERKQVIGVLIAFLGVLYLILKGNIGSWTNIEFSQSDILIFIGSVFFSLQNVWVKKYGGKISNTNFTFLTNLLCMFSFLVVLPFTGIGNIGTYSTAFWLSAIGIGCLGSGLAYFLWNAGIKLSSANQAGIFINVVPLSAALFSVVFGESLYLYHLISGIIILLGVFIMKK